MGELLTLQLPDHVSTEAVITLLEELIADLKSGEVEATGIGIAMCGRGGDTISVATTDDLAGLHLAVSVLQRQLLDLRMGAEDADEGGAPN